LRLRDSFDVPEEIANCEHSPAFAKFLFNWFGDTYALTHGQLDLTFLEDLTPTELATARELIRRNLKLRYVHIIEGVSALHDVAAAPILRGMFNDEPNESRRLTIAGAIWKLTRDPVFVDCLNRAKESGAHLFVGDHLRQVLWLDDERAIDFLIDLLDYKAARGVLALLNQLETGRVMIVPPRELPHQPADYRRRRHDPEFREFMTAAIRRRNMETKNGR
jgi:hypothetical protein